MATKKKGSSDKGNMGKTMGKYYDLSVTLLSDNIDRYIRTRRERSIDISALRHFPIRIKLSIAVTLVISLTMLSVGFIVLERQKKQLYQQTIKTGEVSLTYFLSSSKIPLINDNILALNLLIKEADHVEGVLYAFITDTTGIIKAHTNFELIGKNLTDLRKNRMETKKKGITYYNYRNRNNEAVLNISSHVRFQDNLLGEVNVGISLDFIDQQIKKESWFLFLLSLLIISIGITGAILFGIGFSRPIKQLVNATKQISKGNYQHQVHLKTSDEFTTLANSFNYMADELRIKSIIQETFGRYISPEVLDMILAHPEQAWLKAIKCEATILFTDIRGFTAYAENKEPEAVVEALNQYFSIATEAILDQGGYVDKFIGDAVLGVFGTPISCKDHSERAVKAALLMQNRLKNVAQKQQNGILDKIGIGIDTGVVVSGNLGSDIKMEYSIIGDSVNLASRINSFADAMETIISQNVYDVIHCHAEALAPRLVKGRSEAIQTYRVLSLNK